MNEIWLSIGAQRPGLRLLLTSVSDRHGIALGHLVLEVEATSRDHSAPSCPLRLSGWVEGKVRCISRYELARRTLTFLCDLGAHPDVDETERRQAHSAVLMVGGLLQGVEPHD